MSKSPWIALLILASVAHGQELGDDPPPQHPVWEELERLRARLDALEISRGTGSMPPVENGIDLSDEQISSFGAAHADHTLARAWYENVDLSGYGAFSYLDTGGTGTAPDGSFLVQEASLFLDAEVWKNAYLFVETWIVRYPQSDQFSVGELNVRLTDLFAEDGERGIGLKAGRIEVPFGEDYLRWDANETPLITFSAADPYGIDEGVELYGSLGSVGWLTAVTNGTSGSGADDSAGKLVALKLYGDPCTDLYVSASALTMGDTARSGFRLSGSAITPVGASGTSSAGVSPSTEVNSNLVELDAWIAGSRRANVRLQVGGAWINDKVDAFDRDLIWFEAEPALRVNDKLELVMRYSEIATDESDEGYIFSGKPIAQAEDFGYDTHSLSRLSAGARWTFNPHLALKAEVGHDWIDLIDISPLSADNDERLFFGIELVAQF